MDLSISELLRRFEKKIRSWAIFYGHHVYRVVRQEGNRLDVQAVGSLDGLPDQLVLEKSHGLQGITQACAEGALVLVAFRGGSPGDPYIAGYLPGALPATTNIDATDAVNIGQSADEVNLADAARTVLRSGDTLSIPGLGDVVVVLAPASSASKVKA